MQKKSQISIFLVVAVLIMAAFIFYIIITVPEQEEIIDNSDVRAAVSTFVEGCLQIIADEAVVHIGNHGGYYKLTAQTKNFNKLYPYYFFESTVHMPGLERVQKEIAKYMDENLNSCLNDFAEFKRQGMNLESVAPATDVSIGQSEVLFALNMPITVMQREQEMIIEDFLFTKKEIRLKPIHDSIQELMLDQIRHPDSICLSCMINVGDENGFIFHLQRVFSNVYIVTVRDQQSPENYTFRYMNRYEEYSCKNIPPNADHFFLQHCIDEAFAEAGANQTVST